MSLSLEFLPEAFSDAESAVTYYEQCLSGLGVRFRVELEVIGSNITQNPLL
jgi:hypothetical protein